MRHFRWAIGIVILTTTSVVAQQPRPMQPGAAQPGAMQPMQAQGRASAGLGVSVDQNGMMYGNGAGPNTAVAMPDPLLSSPSSSGPIDLRAASWTFVPASPIRTYKLHDIVKIRIDESARVRAEGNAESRKNTLYDAILRDWLRLDGFAIKPARQADGDPRVRESSNQLYRADASMETRESLTMNIAAEIVDIRPNGTMVLEAHKMIWINENAWDTSLSGICRATDIGPDNVILSRDILDLQINKQERGQLKDGYRRGWFQRWLETLQPF